MAQDFYLKKNTKSRCVPDFDASIGPIKAMFVFILTLPTIILDLFQILYINLILRKILHNNQRTFLVKGEVKVWTDSGQLGSNTNFGALM